MQFNSYEFILLFLPLAVFGYFMANKISLTLGKAVIVAASIVFYSYGRLQMLLFLCLSILLNYAFVFAVKKKYVKNRFIFSLLYIVNVGLLLYFKYLNFALESLNSFAGTSFSIRAIILPLGISFYTFQQIAYIAAVQNGELDNLSFVDYLVYILYFPKLIMGPLAEPADFITQINETGRKKINISNFAAGIKLFSFGLIKKVLFADTFARGVSWVYENLSTATSADCVLLAIFYTFEIYFDFSGYSDMAAGTSFMLNIDLPMNFDSPYKAISIRDFWKRWHISLTRFLTKYVYIPLGGSRRGKILTYINTMIVFLVSGLWHGANWTFILWGLLHGLLSCADRAFSKFQEKVFLPVRWLCTMAAVSILWLLFSADSIAQWKEMVCNIIFMQNTSISQGVIDSFNIAESQFLNHMLHLKFFSDNIRGFNMLMFLISGSVICLIPENNYRNRFKLNYLNLALASLAFVWGILCLGAESTFVYFGF